MLLAIVIEFIIFIAIEDCQGAFVIFFQFGFGSKISQSSAFDHSAAVTLGNQKKTIQCNHEQCPGKTITKMPDNLIALSAE